LGYDSPGYGYGVKDKDGVPLVQKGLGELAKKFNVPYVVDNAWESPSSEQIQENQRRRHDV
jgi:hypothetical protein